MGADSSSKSRKRPQPSASASTQTDDPRFAAAQWDPRFSRVPKRAKKAVTDDRFTQALKTNEGFQTSSAPVDKFGRPKRGVQLQRALREVAQGSDESSSEDDVAVRIPALRAGVDDDSSEESDVEEIEEEEVEEIPRGRATRRLAVLGLDWSSTRAVDIFACLQGFCPTGKGIVFVEVHPSKFGLERLKREARFGPQVVDKQDLEVVEEAKRRSLIGEHDDLASDDESSGGSSDESEDDDDEETKWKAQLALRKYEEDRLKYYYGVVEFEDVRAADAVYEQCDGVEYAQSGRAFDLRFIPEEMKIETTARDRAEKIPDGYTPPNVNPSSLNNSNVKLTWDADDPDRVILKKKAVGKQELDEENLKAYLAGSSEEDEDGEGEKELQRKKNLLLGSLEQPVPEDEGLNMEVTFDPGMLEKGEEIMKRKFDREEQKDETPWEARLRRQQERKAEKRRLRRESLASMDREGAEGLEDVETNEEQVENPTFDSDPFFSIERDLDEEEAKERRSRKRKNKKEKPAKTAEARDGDDSAKAEKQREAELELLMMDDKRKNMNEKTSMRDVLAAVESDDDDDREKRRKEKRTRGKRRSQKMAAENGTAAKPSAVDTNDPRFQGLFDSHLFAMDPTHPKFRQNETTERILKEKVRRSNMRDKDNNAPSVEKNSKTRDPTENAAKKSSSEAMELVARIKAKAALKRKEKLKAKRKV